MRRLALLLVVAAVLGTVVLVLAHGRGDERGPLESLEEKEPSSAYNLAFWVREERRGSELWSRALASCRATEEWRAHPATVPRLPNCRTVRLALLFAELPELPATGAEEEP